jgi:hypothetical protein
VPHYVGGPYAAAAIAILEHLGRHLGVEPPLDGLPDEAMAQRERLDQIVQADDDSRTYVERLESSWTTRSCRPATSSWARSSASCSNAATGAQAVR